MKAFTRLTLILAALCSALIPLVSAQAAPKEAEYKRIDTNYYWKGDVLKAEPSAIILPLSEFKKEGDSYKFTPKKKAPKEIYVSVVNDWIEPITPPDMPNGLGINLDEMQIREIQGEVKVALPSAPATYIDATDKMVIPNGSVIKTGADGTVAVLFGGINSTRLIPNSEAAVQQTVEPALRSTEVDLTRGAAFSKVGKVIGLKQDYKVHTPLAVAAARGTDFVSVAMPSRTDVWIAEGTVQLDQTDGKVVGSVSSESTGGLKIIRYPLMPDAHAAMMASAQTMTAAMDIIPKINVKMNALHERMEKGEKLTANELAYINRVKKVPCLIKLSLVEPPPPEAPKPAVPVEDAPAPAAATPAAVPAARATPDMTPRTDESGSSLKPKKKKKNAQPPDFVTTPLKPEAPATPATNAPPETVP